MNISHRGLLAIFFAGIWVNASEFLRNELLLKKIWIVHYRQLGLTFPSEPVNGMMWILWGFLFSFYIYVLSRKFTFLESAFISWFSGFLLMWIVIGNLNVLPSGILLYAIPLSMIECIFAVWIIKKFSTWQ